MAITLNDEINQDLKNKIIEIIFLHLDLFIINKVNSSNRKNII